MGWLITLGVVLLFLLIPLCVSVRYDHLGLHAYLFVGTIPISLYPLKKKPKKEKRKSEKKPKPTGQKKTVTNGKNGGSFKVFLPLIQSCLDFLREFGSKLCVKRLEMKLVFAGGDPCDLAINYGRVWAAVGNILPRMEQFFIVKNQAIDVQCDFTSNETIIRARLDVSIVVIKLIALVLFHGIRILREYVKIMNQRKGGAKYEPKST